MSMARLLYWGCDVWLNNPLRPLEACGTSGMKSALNGGLNLSIRDGWWDEWYDGENGWEIPSADGVADETRRDDLESSALYTLLEQAVAPKFYERDEQGRAAPLDRDGASHAADPGPEGAGVADGARLRGAVLRAGRAVAARRPSRRPRDRLASSARARELAAYRRRVEEAWPRVTVTDVDSTGLPDTPLLGSKLTLTATVQLAGLAPEEVTVQAVVGRVDSGDVLLDPVTVDMSYTGTAGGGNQVFSTTTPLPLAGSVGYTVRVLPRHPLLAAGNELGLVALAR